MLTVLHKKIQEIPLRHEGEHLAMRGKMCEIADLDGLLPNCGGQFRHLLMRPLEEFLQQPEFVHQFQSRRMDGVAAKVAEKIRMLFENDDFSAHTGQ